MPKIDVQRIVDGLEFGEGAISHKERVEEVGGEKMQAVEEALTSGELIVPIDVDAEGHPVDDDGCGDGRVWKRVFRGAIEKFRSLRRAKVFGGGAAMATATTIGLGTAVKDSLQNAFSNGINLLKQAKIDFGGHTDSHSHGPNCGCGALDKAPAVIVNAVKYADQIKASITGLGIETDGLDDVLSNYEDYAAQIPKNAVDYSGADVMGKIIDSGKIVKELDGTHNEMYIVLNLVEGHTIDQDKVRELSDGDIQVFVVDVWRLKSLANRLYADQSSEVRHKAFLSELVYTLGVAATLTKGDLPVYVVSPQPELAAA